MDPHERLVFLREFLRNPAQLGTLLPSSRWLESRLVRAADVSRAKLVVELGPGTGGTTSAILEALPPQGTLLAIDVCSPFIAQLARWSDPRLVPHLGSAETLLEILASYGMPQPDVVISGIPFSTLSRKRGRRIIRSIWSCLSPGGRFVAYQMQPRVEELMRDLAGPPQVEWEWLNVPPLRVYRWEKRNPELEVPQGRPGNVRRPARSCA